MEPCGLPAAGLNSQIMLPHHVGEPKSNKEHICSRRSSCFVTFAPGVWTGSAT